ncbi:MAG: hypothetical protein JKY32_07235 [Rhizobiales bacterium]|nr:hypothetical protein [Hyphomicrobiales bacterium]
MFDNIRATIRNIFKKPTDIPMYLSGKDPMEDAYNVPPVSVAGNFETYMECVNRHMHEELSDVQLHLISAIDLAEHKHRPRASMRATLTSVTSELLQLENTMHRLAK